MIGTKEKFYTAKYDRVFKEIFLKKENEDLLKKLLKVALKEVSIKEIKKVLNIEKNSGNIHVRRKYVDVLLETDIGLVGIEINSSVKDYLHVRNLAYQCDTYAHYTETGEYYREDIYIIQINLTYGIKNDEEIMRVYEVQDKNQKKFVENFQVIEYNMDKVMEYWYTKDEKKIKEYLYLILLDLEKEELEEVAKESLEVEKYMKDLEKVNEDPRFREFMTKEEDERKIRNTEIYAAREEGLSQGFLQGSKQEKIEIAKKMLSKDKSIEEIMEFTSLTKNEIDQLS